MRKLILAVLILTGCTSVVTAPQTQDPVAPAPPVVVPAPAQPQTPPPVATPEPVAPPQQAVVRLALSWENASKSERALWSDIIIREMDKHSDKFSKANDTTDFCPKFNSLPQGDKKRALAEIVVAVIYYETAFDPNSRMVETTMGKDCVTGRQISSEGLLQLSYCDMTWASNCKFDWSKDKLLAEDDPKKTILNPEINLICGIGIMADQVKNKGNFAFDKSNYWAVLRPNGKYGQVPGIKARVKKGAPYCY